MELYELHLPVPKYRREDTYGYVYMYVYKHVYIHLYLSIYLYPHIQDYIACIRAYVWVAGYI